MSGETVRLFVPALDQRLAVRVRLPDAEPTDAMLLMPRLMAPLGLGGVWDDLTEELLASGVVSVRFDYIGTGQSTGLMKRWRMDDLDAFGDQAAAVMQRVLEATGLESFVTVGVCGGAYGALRLAAITPACRSIVCIDEPLYRPNSRTHDVGTSASSKGVVDWLRGTPVGRPVLERLASSMHAREARDGGAWIVRRCAAALANADITFVSGLPHANTRFSEIERLISPGLRGRLDAVYLPWDRGLEGLESFELQDLIRPVMCEWLRSRLRVGSADTVSRGVRADSDPTRAAK